MFGMQDFRPYRDVPTIGLIDAGLAFNLPFPPLNDYKGSRPERKPDVIIFIDASADADDDEINIAGQPGKQAWPTGQALRDVKDYARINEVPFPKIPDGGNLGDETCSIFNEQYTRGRQEPVVIYLPLAKNKAECNNRDLLAEVTHADTFYKAKPTELANIDLVRYPTKYTDMSNQDSVNLVALMHYNVLNNRSKIVDAICARIQGRPIVSTSPGVPEPSAQQEDIVQRARLTIEGLFVVWKSDHATMSDKEAERKFIKRFDTQFDNTQFIVDFGLATQNSTKQERVDALIRYLKSRQETQVR